MYAGGNNSDNQSAAEEPVFSRKSSLQSTTVKTRSRTEDKELIKRLKDYKKLIGRFNPSENETFQRGRAALHEMNKPEQSPAQGPTSI